jgi:hypothetical protein
MERCLWWEIQDGVVDTKCREAERRFMQQKPGIGEIDRRSIAMYFKSLEPVAANLRARPSYPLPTNKACFGYSRRKGGAAKALKDQRTDSGRFYQQMPFSKAWEELHRLGPEWDLTRCDVILRRDEEVPEKDLEKLMIADSIQAAEELDQEWLEHREALDGELSPGRAFRVRGFPRISAAGKQQPRLQYYKALTARGKAISMVVYTNPTKKSRRPLRTWESFRWDAESQVDRMTVTFLVDLEQETTPEMVGRKALSDCYLEPSKKMEVVGLKEKAGKVRVASLHEAHMAHAARVLTTTVIPVIGALVSTRDLLNNQEVVLKPHGAPSEKVLLYSADLSKATDEASHELAQVFWTHLAELLRLDDSMTLAGLELLGPQELVRQPNERGEREVVRTQSGIHMGLGLSWTLLCLINGWAAWQAGAKKDSYAIHGDDLIANWAPSRCDAYEDAITRVGLVINKAKSFRGKNGVFCERFVSYDKNSRIARSRSMLTMSEATASKAGNSPTGETSWFATLQLLATSRNGEVLDQLRKRTLDAKHKKGLPQGPVELGGSGLGAPTRELTLAALLRGKLQGSRPRTNNLQKEEIARIAETVTAVPTGRSDVLMDEALQRVRYDHRRTESLAGRLPAEHVALTKARFRAESKRRTAEGRRVLEGKSSKERRITIRQIVRQANVSTKAKRLIHRLTLWDPELTKARTRVRVANAIEDRKSWVSEELLEFLAQPDRLPTPWRSHQQQEAADNPPVT